MANQVAVLAFPFGTHAAPLLAVVRRLADVAPEATFSFFNSKRSNSSLFSETEGRANIRPYDIPEGIISAESKGVIDEFMETAREHLRERLAAMKITCILSDAFMYFAGEIAEVVGVPWAAFWTAGPASLCVHLHTNDIRSRFSDGELNLDFIPGMSIFRAGDLPEGVLLGSHESAIPIILHRMSSALPKAKTVAINSFQDLCPEITHHLKQNLNHFLSIAPLHRPVFDPHDPYRCLPWLHWHEPRSVVYVSFGSVVSPSNWEVTEIVEALEAMDLPFLWALKGDVNPLVVREKGKVVPWAPQKEVLAHPSVGVFLTHGGWNSVMEAVAGQVPMICRPFFGDQKINAACVERLWQVGQVVDGIITKKELETCLRTIMSSTTDEGKRMREKINVLKKLAEKSNSEDGSSTHNFLLLKNAILNVENLTCIKTQ